MPSGKIRQRGPLSPLGRFMYQFPRIGIIIMLLSIPYFLIRGIWYGMIYGMSEWNNDLKEVKGWIK